MDATVFSVAWSVGERIHSARFSRMAFNLKKVLKALLFSTNQPLGIKDIQAAFTRFHESATLPAAKGEEDAPKAASEPIPAPAGAVEASGASEPVATPSGEATPADGAATADGSSAATPSATPAPAAEVAEEMLETADDPELYVDVPSLITATQIRETMDAIAAELRAADDGLLLIEGGNGYRLVTAPRFARWVRILRSEPPPVKLSQSSVETLAIIAYRQPVTRGEIETIRGVSAEAGINKLLERELIYVVGRADLPGRPIQYGTTDAFLEFVGVKSLDELPASDVLSSRQIDEWLKNAESAIAPSDTDMGLANEQLPLEASSEAPAAESQPAGAAADESTPEVAEPPAAEPAGSKDEPSAAS